MPAKTTQATALPELTPAKAAAAEIGIPYTSLRDCAFRGEIPVIRVGRRWYFDRRDLLQFLETAKERLG